MHITVASQQNNYTGRQSIINQIHFFKSKHSKGVFGFNLLLLKIEN